MDYYRLYPYATDNYNAAEISVTPGISTELLPTALYLKQDLILRMNQTPYIDSSPNNLFASANQGLVTITEDATLGRNVAVFNGSSNLLAPTSETLFGGAIAQLQASVMWNQDGTQTTDACVAHYYMNGVRFRFFISGGQMYWQVFHSDGSNAYLRAVVTKDTWNTATIYIVNNPTDVTFYAWLNGSYIGSKTTAGKSGSTTSNNSTIGSEPTNTSYFKGYLADITLCGEVCTLDESLELNTNSIKKYPAVCYYEYATDITDPQLLQFGDFDADFDGTVDWRASIDNGNSFEQYDGNSWTSEGSDYNNVATVSANIASLSAENQVVRFKARLTSDGWTQVYLRYLQLGYAINLSPIVYPGTAIITTVGQIITPGAGFSYSDPDNNVTQLYRKWDDEARVAVAQGGFGSQLEALQAWQLDTTGMTPGNYSFTVFAQDALGLEDSASIQVCIQAATLENIYALLQTVSGNLDLVKIETDKIPAVKTATDTIPDVIVTQGEHTTSLGDLTSAVAGIDASVGSVTSDLAAVATTTDNIELLTDQVHDRFYGTKVTYANGIYTVYSKTDQIIASFRTKDENGTASGTRVLQVERLS